MKGRRSFYRPAKPTKPPAVPAPPPPPTSGGKKPLILLSTARQHLVTFDGLVSLILHRRGAFSDRNIRTELTELCVAAQRTIREIDAELGRDGGPGGD